jgi:hypothetical protein
MQTKLNNTNNPEWQEAHRINQKNKPRTVLKNFDAEITAKEREGFEYDPFKLKGKPYRTIKGYREL